MATRHLRDWLRELRAQGRCVLLSSHVMQEVEALVDDLVIIAAGRVTLTGSPAELAQRFPGRSLEEIFVEAVRGAERTRRMSALLTVCRKELLETLRERRMLVSLLLGPLFGPILFTVHHQHDGVAQSDVARRGARGADPGRRARAEPGRLSARAQHRRPRGPRRRGRRAGGASSSRRACTTSCS